MLLNDFLDLSSSEADIGRGGHSLGCWNALCPDLEGAVLVMDIV